MRIVSYNIRFGGQKHKDLIASCLNAIKPDIVILIEAYKSHVVKWLAQELDFPYVGSFDGYSAAFISKSAPQNFKWIQGNQLRTPLLQIQFDKNISIYGIHLSSLLTTRMEHKRTQEIRQILEIIAQDKKNPHILIGDFNAIAPNDKVMIRQMPYWLQMLIWLNRGTQSQALETLMSANYVDVFRHFHPDDAGYTLPPPKPNTRLDYAFVPASLVHTILDCRVIREPNEINIASDHYPLLLDLAI